MSVRVFSFDSLFIVPTRDSYHRKQPNIVLESQHQVKIKLGGKCTQTNGENGEILQFGYSIHIKIIQHFLPLEFGTP